MFCERQKMTLHLSIIKNDSHQSQKCYSQWYEHYEWLTQVSLLTNCFAVCFLFGDNSKGGMNLMLLLL